MTVVAFPTQPPPPPTITEHDGRAVTWDAWHDAGIGYVCPGGVIACECGAVEGRLFAFGAVAPLPGETFEVPRRLRRSGREVADATVRAPAWPVKRLYASLCTACGEFEVYDIAGGGFETVEVGKRAQLGLFE